MMPVHHLQVSPCLIILKYVKCAANVMVSRAYTSTTQQLADVIANTNTNMW